MSTYIVRPSSVITPQSGTSPSSSATVLTNLNDNSDTTSVTNALAANNASLTYLFALGAPSIASDEFVCRVGQSARWKQSTTNQNVVGVAVYRKNTTKPGAYPSVIAYSQAAAVTTEVGYQTVSWTPTECSNLNLIWYDLKVKQSYPTTVYDLWATIYTVKKATATPAATTWSSSTSPTINVDVTATLDDWQVATYDWQNIRKVTVEVQVESGGTGVGTGTLIANKTLDVFFTASGSTTQTMAVSMNTSMTNASYKIYARAIRHREGETSVAADQISAWSSAATLTMSVTPPSAPTLSVSPDQVNDKVNVTVTPVSSTGYSTPTIDVERSDDNGTTWKAVRGATGISGAFGTAKTFYDYECPRGVTVNYRARQNAVTGTVTNTSAWSGNQSTSITATDWNLKCPENAALNMLSVSVTGNPQENLVEEVGVFRPLDRKFAVVVAGTLGGWDGELTITTASSSDWSALKALLECQKVLLLESPFGWAKYIRVTNGASAVTSGTPSTPRRVVTLQYVQTSVPSDPALLASTLAGLVGLASAQPNDVGTSDI